MTYKFQKERYTEKTNSYWCKKCKKRHSKGSKQGIVHYKYRSKARGFCYQLSPIAEKLLWKED